jgi:integrase
LLKKGSELPDAWKPRAPKHASEQVPTIYFKDTLFEIKNYVKTYAYQQYYLVKNDPKTVNIKVSKITRFYAEFVVEKCSITTNVEQAFIKQISQFKGTVRVAVIESKEGDAKRTALGRALEMYAFLLFIEHYTSANKWVHAFDLHKELPKKLVKYFSNKELELYRMQLVAAQKRNKTPSLGWSTTYDITKFIDDFEGFNYALNAVAIAIEAGLRISEIRALKRDCLRPVTNEEEKMVVRYFARQGKAPIKLDYSQSRWLTYHVIKGKGGELFKGTPILVGKRVINAINRVLDYTTGLAEESGSDMLFLNRYGYGNKIKVRGSAAFLKDLYDLYELGMPIVRFHQCRATFATILYHLGIPIGVIEKYMNHVSSEVTKGYIDSMEDESTSSFGWLIQNKVDEGADERLKALQEELLSLVGTAEFFGLTHSSRLKLFERLRKKNGVVIKMSDHGVCVLPSGEKCQYGYEEILPCHASNCSHFNPDADKEAEDFFLDLLKNNTERIKELEIEAFNHAGLEVNFDILILAKNSLQTIVNKIKKAS